MKTLEIPFREIRPANPGFPIYPGSRAKTSIPKIIKDPIIYDSLSSKLRADTQLVLPLTSSLTTMTFYEWLARCTLHGPGFAVCRPDDSCSC